MQYLRMYASPDGESHFEEVELTLQEAFVAAYNANIGRSETFAAAPVWFGRLPAPAAERKGEWGPWHPAPRRQFVVRLQGEAEIQVSDGEVRRLGPGSVVLAEDTSGSGHRNRTFGESRMLYVPLAE